MEKERLLKLVLLVSILGLLLLCILAQFTKPLDVKIYEVESHLGQKVAVTGTAVKVTHLPKVTFVDLKDDKDSVSAVLFGLPNRKIENGETLKIIGRVARYKGKVEIIIEEILG